MTILMTIIVIVTLLMLICYTISSVTLFSFFACVLGDPIAVLFLLAFWGIVSGICIFFGWMTNLGNERPWLKDLIKIFLLACIIHLGIVLSGFSFHVHPLLVPVVLLAYFGTFFLAIYHKIGLKSFLLSFHVLSSELRTEFSYRPAAFEELTKTLLFKHDDLWHAIKWICIHDPRVTFEKVIQLVVSDPVFTELTFEVQKQQEAEVIQNLTIALNALSDYMRQFRIKHEIVRSELIQEKILRLPFIEYDWFKPPSLQHDESIWVSQGARTRAFKLYKISQLKNCLSEFLTKIYENPLAFEDFALIFHARILDEDDLNRRSRKLEKRVLIMANQLSEEMTDKNYDVLKSAFGEQLLGRERNPLLHRVFHDQMDEFEQAVRELNEFSEKATIGLWDVEGFFMGAHHEARVLKSLVQGELTVMPSKKLPRCLQREFIKPELANSIAILNYLPFPVPDHYL
ncbi:MAG: hypothetical protein ACTSRW_11440 [Candidatus Helarchaeota archaeon]